MGHSKNSKSKIEIRPIRKINNNPLHFDRKTFQFNPIKHVLLFLA